MDKSLLYRRRFLTYLGLGTLGISSAAIATQFSSPRISKLISPKASTEINSTAKLSKSNSSEVVSASSNQKLPEFQGISQWLNSKPLTVQELKGNVVLIQFWTFGCINCQRTLPYVTSWHEQYAANGLKIIGVHTPEFAFERDVNNIKDAIRKHGINYTVALDNQFKTWKAYNNEYWPHLYIADRDGNLRYDRIGEGSYSKTEQIIQQLLG